MPVCQIPRKIFNYHAKGSRDGGRLPKRWKYQFTYLGDHNKEKGINLVDDEEVYGDDFEQGSQDTSLCYIHVLLHLSYRLLAAQSK
jgi:hypothetical protein